MLVAREASAHQVGVSRGEYAASGAHLDAHVALSRREILTTIPGIDADDDGLLSQPELDAKRADVEHLFAGEMHVTESGVACPGKLTRAALEEPDGVAIDVAFDCPSPGTRMSIELGFLADLGSGHRHLAHATGKGIASDDLYYRGKDRIDLPVDLTSAGSTSPLLTGARTAVVSLDSLLVAAGLMLTLRGARSIGGVLAAFAGGTVAALAATGWAGFLPSPAILPTMTALSVVYVGIEDLLARTSPHRWAVALSLGGLHGFAIAALLGYPTGAASVVAGGGALGAMIAVAVVAAGIFAGARRWRSFEPWGRTACAVLIAIAGAAKVVLTVSRALQ